MSILNRIEAIKLHDNCVIKFKYSYPENTLVEKLVIYVNGSGPNTYENKRQWIDGTTFNYHDLFINEFNKRGIAYCSYNTRGVDMGENPPLYAEINDDEYKTYLPSNSVKDIESIITYLKQKDEFKNAKIYLLGWSEGTIIAPLVALNNNVKVDALLLAGYCNENLKDVLVYQLQGNSEFTLWRRLFDYDKKGYITKDDFETDKYNARKALFGDAAFEDLDANHDGILTVEDAGARSIPHLNDMLKAIENNDDEWLKNNHGVRLTSGWFKEHFNLKPNKEILPLLDLPIFIFQGEYDTMCTKKYAENIRQKFDELNKTNLTVYIFNDHDHDLNYHLFHVTKEVPLGIRTIINTVENL